jgi:small subunit ribosomal protein S33
MAAPARLAALKQLQCAVFQTTYNPTSARTGAKYLRARLRGPAMVRYYPETLDITSMRKGRAANFMVDFAERQRLQDVEDKKARGKGTPTKAKSSGTFFGLLWGERAKEPLLFFQRTVGARNANGRAWLHIDNIIIEYNITTQSYFFPLHATMVPDISTGPYPQRGRKVRVLPSGQG